MTERRRAARPAHLATKLLYVEDDRDCREMVAEVFVDAGFEVTAVDSAERALEVLAGSHYDVVLTDYHLPGATGAWLLATASSQGYLEKTAALVLTSERKPAGVDGYRVLHKPIAFGKLLAIIGGATGEILAQPVVSLGAPPPTELELVLYVTSTSQDSQTAIRNVHRALRPFDSNRFRLTIVDVGAGADDGWAQRLEDDHVIVTPTLVRTKPGPKTWILGTLSPGDAVDDLLASALGGRAPAA
jgi:CheY-like chemotaxis protein